MKFRDHSTAMSLEFPPRQQVDFNQNSLRWEFSLAKLWWCRKWRDPEDFNWFFTEMKLIFCCMQICTRMHWIALFYLLYCTPRPRLGRIESTNHFARQRSTPPSKSRERPESDRRKTPQFLRKNTSNIFFYFWSRVMSRMYRFDRSCLSPFGPLFRSAGTRLRFSFSLFSSSIRDEKM